ncbi:MAG: hypothetical protein NZ772_13325 [Cyanobacteria bacterium]|nr:hypothetical protein [Cyanobacteriota bacterium]MDW8202372.1 hypothetical protein [Cyanobacteriota bacterium SKYGB_h_bin112]
MEHGLAWLPLLAIFFWLAWAGWNEYQKVEAYRQWAQPFETAKYDIYSVLGYANGAITWGLPSRRGPVNLQTIPLATVQSITLMLDHQPVQPDQVSLNNKSIGLRLGGRSVSLQLVLTDNQTVIQIPFTDITLADQWQRYLQAKVLAEA